ncbi:MAG: hypothetical protein J6J11_01245, partial [Treponema sp.]|nr:hypothetical protein [Treponema sp.]
GAKLAKVEMSELQSLIAIIGETTQKDASVIGESLKTAFSRYANVKATSFVNNPHLSSDENLMNKYALETEASESGDGTAVNDIEKVLKVVDIDIRNGEEWRSYSDILKELGEGWKTYSDYEKNAIVTAMFGTRQRENGIVALTNYNRVLEANEVAINSVGTATQKMEIYSQGLESAQNRVTAAWEKLVMDLEAGGVIQNVSETIESLIENFVLLATIIGSGVLIANLDKVFVALTKFSVLFNSKMSMAASLGKGFFTGNFSGFKERMSNSIDKANQIAEDGKVDIDNIRNQKTQEFNDTITVTIEELKNFGQVINKLRDSLTQNTSETDKNTSAKQNEATASQQATNADVNEATASQQATNADVNEATASQQATVTKYGGGVYGITIPGEGNIESVTTLRQLKPMSLSKSGKYRTPQDVSNSTNIKSLMNNPKFNSKNKSLPKISGTTGTQVGSMAVGMLGMIGGSQLGSQIAEGLHLDETGQMMGSVIGGGLVSTISSSLIMGGHPIIGAAIGIGSLVIGGIISGIKKHKENILKELTKDLAKVEEKYNNLTSIDTQDKVAKWDKLSQGVNSFGENVSLTNTQYEEYLSLSNEIGEMFPSLISRTDAFGNSIINVGDDVDTLTEKLKKMQETARNETIDAYFREKDGVSNASQAFDDFKKKADAKEIEKYGSVYTGSEMNPTQLYINWDEINISDEEKKELIKEAQKYLNKNFAPNLYSDDFKTQWNSVSTLYDVTTPDELWDKLSAFADKKIFEIEQKYKKTEMVKNTADYRSKLIEDVIGFKDLGGEISSFLMNFTAGVDVTQFENEEDYQNFLKDHIINLYNDANDKDNVKNLISNLKDDLNNETKSLAELNESYNTNIGSAKGNIVNHINGMKTDEERKDFYSKYGLTYEKTEDGTEILKNSLGEEVSQEKFIEEYTGFQNVGKNLIDELINKTGTKEDFVKKLNQGEAKFLNSLSIDTLDLIKKDKNFKTWEDSLQNYLDNHYVNTIYSAKSNLEKLVKDNKDAEDALSQLFEDYNEDNIEKFLLTLNSDDAKKALKYFEDMDKRAKILGLDIEDAIKKASVLSHIDIYGRSSKSVKQASDDASQILEWKQAVANGTLTPEQFDEMKLVSPKAASETDPDKIIEAL